jgi:hypothetical protein
VLHGVAELTEVLQGARQKVVQIDQFPLLAIGSLKTLLQERLTDRIHPRYSWRPASQYLIRFARQLADSAPLAVHLRTM